MKIYVEYDTDKDEIEYEKHFDFLYGSIDVRVNVVTGSVTFWYTSSSSQNEQFVL